MADTEETTDECLSLAGRVLAGGNPLDNEQVMAAFTREIAMNASKLEPEGVREAVRVVFGTYFDNALSLAGHVLGEESAEVAEESAADLADELEEEPGDEVDLLEIDVDAAILGLLKGMHPHGTTWAHLAIAVDQRGSELSPLIRELIAEEKVRQDDATVYATLNVVADKSIKPLPWPKSSFK